MANLGGSRVRCQAAGPRDQGVSPGGEAPPTPASGKQLLRAALGAQRRRLAASSVLFAAHQGGEALVPLLIGVVIDQAVAGGDTAALLWWLGALAGVFLVLSLAWQLGLRRAQLAALRAGQRVRLDLAARVLHPCGGADDARLPGELVNVATEDAARLGRVGFGLPPAVSALAGVGVAAAALLWVSVPLGLVVLFGTPPLLAGLRLLSRPLEHRSRAEQHQAGQASGIAADLVDGLRVLKGAGAAQQARERYRVASRSSLAATLRATRAQAVYKGGFLAANGVLLALVALVGGLLAMGGEISPGELVAGVGLAQYLIGPLGVFGWFTGVLAQGRASADRVAAVLSAPPAVTAGAGALPTPVRGELALCGVREGALAGVELTAHAGELLGVVAEPAEATALLRCLGRDADPQAGHVAIDGVALAELDPADVRSVVLVSAHDAALFEDSLAANAAAAARPGAHVDAAMRAARADDVARALPGGAASTVGEAGRSLSGGQRQRVALARALAADPPVLVLHDPTTAVDPVTEARVAEGLRELRRGRTTILVTTSPALLAVADRVVVLVDGMAGAEGTHAELARTCGAYRRAVLE